MSPGVSSDTRSLAQKLFIDLSPGIFQSYGAVEYQMSGGGIFVDIEITDTLELQIREARACRPRTSLYSNGAVRSVNPD